MIRVTALRALGERLSATRLAGVLRQPPRSYLSRAVRAAAFMAGVALIGRAAGPPRWKWRSAARVAAQSATMARRSSEEGGPGSWRVRDDWVRCCELLRQEGDARAEGVEMLRRLLGALSNPRNLSRVGLPDEPDLVRSLVEDTVALILALGGPANCATFGPYAVHCWLVAVKDERKRRTTGRPGPGPASPTGQAVALPPPTPEQLAARAEEAERNREAWLRCFGEASLEQLIDLDVVRSRQLEGQSWEDICMRLHLSSDEARLRCFRGLVYLRRCFGRDPENA